MKLFLTRVYLFAILPLAALSSIYIFLYPFWKRCAFPEVDGSSPSYLGTKEAPFRLLTLADPQIEGDTRLRRILLQMPKESELGVSGKWRDLASAFWQGDTLAIRAHLKFNWDYVVTSLQYGQKWVDIWGNDLYLAHVFRTMYWYIKPSHTVVLGDLLSSHWIQSEEFHRRAGRFWNLIFRGMEKVTEEDVARNEEVVGKSVWGVKDTGVNWAKKVMNIVGNHDIGYAGDINRERVDRFEDRFGKLNYIWTFKPPPPPANFTFPTKTKWATQLPTFTSSTQDGPKEQQESDEGGDMELLDSVPPSLRIIILNDLTLDIPLWDPTMAEATYDIINSLKSNPLLSLHQASLLLTHIPFHKPTGVCTDGPLFDYYEPRYGAGVKKQNHLSDTSSQLLLGRIFGLPTGDPDMTRRRKPRGLILTGHDHPGCDVWHYFAETHPGAEKNDGRWNATKYRDKPHMEQARSQAVGDQVQDYTSEGVREITVRSMMGEFEGNAGLMSAWFDWEKGRWEFRYDSCALGVQHIWWGTHVVLVVAAVMTKVLGLWWVVGFVAGNMGRKGTDVGREKKVQ